MKLHLAILIVIAMPGCGGGSATPPPQSAWQTFKASDASFQIDFPGTPETWVTHFESPEYGSTTVQHVSATFSTMTYGVSYNDYPRVLSEKEAKTELDNTNTVPGLIESSEVKIGNTTAVQIVSKSWGVYQVALYFIHNSRRLYSIQIGGPQDPREDKATMDLFFDSFTLDETPTAPQK